MRRMPIQESFRVHGVSYAESTAYALETLTAAKEAEAAATCAEVDALALRSRIAELEAALIEERRRADRAEGQRDYLKAHGSPSEVIQSTRARGLRLASQILSSLPDADPALEDSP